MKHVRYSTKVVFSGSERNADEPIPRLARSDTCRMVREEVGAVDILAINDIYSSFVTKVAQFHELLFLLRLQKKIDESVKEIFRKDMLERNMMTPGPLLGRRW